MAGINTRGHRFRFRAGDRLRQELDGQRTWHSLGFFMPFTLFSYVNSRLRITQDLWKIAKQHKRSFAGSTSSLTGLLSHCYFLISGDKEVDTSSLSRAFLHQVSIRGTLAQSQISRLIRINSIPAIVRELLTTDNRLSANEFYPRSTHAYIRGAQLQGRGVASRL